MQNRRDFLKKAFAGSLGLGLATSSSAFSRIGDVISITILHTNDIHSHIEANPFNDSRHPNEGGLRNLAPVIDHVRATEDNVLLLDAGDVFQGTPYFNKYGGELEFKLMSALKYDATTIGNHDFDNGMEGLANMMPHAEFPFLNANYDFKDTPLAGKTRNYQIFTKQGIKIGVYGVGVELDGLVSPSNYGDTKYLDPLEKSAKIAKLLRFEEKCDLVICLSHLGYQYSDKKVSDIILAQNSENVDIIIGGHTHTFLDKPVFYKNKKGKKIMVCQAGWAALQLGRVDIHIDGSSGRKLMSGSAYFSEDFSSF